MCIYLSIFLYLCIFLYYLSVCYCCFEGSFAKKHFIIAMHCIYCPFMTAMTPNLNRLCLWYSTLFTWFSMGFSYALTWTPIVTMLGCYFEMCRPFAKALANTGEWIITFLFTPFFQFQVDNYSWRGAMLVLGAVQLHMCVWCAAEATHCRLWWAFHRSKQTQASVPLPNTPWTTGVS